MYYMCRTGVLHNVSCVHYICILHMYYMRRTGVLHNVSCVHYICILHICITCVKCALQVFYTFMVYYGLFWLESLYPDHQWRFRSEHYFLWGSYSGHYFFHSITHYDITIGNDVARDVHCDIIMGRAIIMGAYHVTMHTDVARTLIYYVLLFPIMIFLFS